MKAATFAAHPILDHGPDHTEMFWFLLELFTESDLNENGIVILTNLTTLLSAKTDNKMFSPPSNADGGHHGAKEEDVSPPAMSDGGHHGAKEEGEE